MTPAPSTNTTNRTLGRTVAIILYGLAVGLAAAAIAVIGPVIVGYVLVWMFGQLGWKTASNSTAGVFSHYTFFIVFAVAVGLTTCLRAWGRRFRKELDPKASQ